MSVHVPELPGRVEDPAEVGQASSPPSRHPLIAGAFGGAWALVVGLALMTFLVMLSWAVSPSQAGNSAAAWRAVGSAWLAAHLVPLEVGGELITLLPVGGLLLGLLLNRRSGGWIGRLLPGPTAAEVIWSIVGAAVAYGAGGAGVAWLANGGAASADPVWAGLLAGSVAAVGTLWGLSREVGLVAAWRARSSQAVWRTLTAGLAAVVALFGAGAVLVTVGLLRSFSEVAGVLKDLDPGPIGAAGVTLLSALSLPNLDVWASGVLVGPGVDLGGIGSISAFGGEVESLPALPVLAAIPAAAPAWAPALLLVPVLIGALAGRIRWGRDLPTVTGALLSALGVAAVVAAGVAGLVVVSSGSLGGDRLAHLGPPLVPMAASAAGLVTLGFLLEAGLQSLRLMWDLHRAERRAAVAGAPEQPAPGVDCTPADAGLAADATGGTVPAADPSLVTRATTAGGSAVRRAAGAAGRAVGTGSAVTSRVAGAGGSVTSRVAGAGAAAVSVVTDAGGAAGALVTSGAAAVGRAAGIRRADDTEVPTSSGETAADGTAPGGTAADGTAAEDAQLEDTPVEQAAAEGDAPVTAVVATPADEDPDASDQDGPARAGDVAEHVPGGGVVDLRVDEDAPVEVDIRDDADATAPEESGSGAGAVDEGAVEADSAAHSDAQGLAQDRGSPAAGRFVGSEDDTDEIPIIRRVAPGSVDTP